MKAVVKFIKSNWLNLALIFLAFFIRLKFSLNITHDDLLTQCKWGETAADLGTLKGFYEWSVWSDGYPNHPPLISSLYYILEPLHGWLMGLLSHLGNFIALHRLAPTKFLWLFNFSIWFGTDLYSTTPILSGVIFLLKQFMIVADLAIAVVIYYLCKKQKKDWKIPVFVYLFLPFSWYISSVWGQSDQLSFIFFVISFILIFSKKYFLLSPLFYAIAANIKPTSLIIAPVYFYGIYKQKQPFIKVIVGGIIAAIFTLWTVSWFTNTNPLLYALTTLPSKVTTSDGFVNYNAFNFWYIFFPFIGNQSPPDSLTFLNISLKVWGWFLSAVTIVLSLLSVKTKKIDNLLGAAFINGFGCCLFLTGIHERYFFLSLMSLFLLSLYQSKYWKYFLATSFIYTLNLFNASMPWSWLGWLPPLIKSNNFLIGKTLSIANLFLYFLATKSILKTYQVSKK